MSCDVYYHICATYDIDGYPTLIGWKQGQSATDGGTVLNEDGDIDAESVAQTLDLDLAQEETSVDAEPEDEEERQRVRETRARQGREAAAARLRRHGHEPRTRNARYHDAALSLAFAVRSQLFQTATAAEGGIAPRRRRALSDFLDLSEWALPRSWRVRAGLVRELRRRLAADAVRDRAAVAALIEGDVDRHRRGGTEDAWGSVEAGAEGGRAGRVRRRQRREAWAEEDRQWSRACTHGQPAKGFTCGLW